MSDLKQKLAEAGEKAVKQKKERQARAVKGAHLTEQLVQIARDAGLSIRENTGFFVISGPAGKNVRIAVAKRGGIVDFLSFTVNSPAVRQISREEAAEKHLGRVQGRIAFDGTDEETIQAYNEAVNVLLVPEQEPVKSPKVKVPPVVKPPPTTEVTAAPVP